MVAGSAGVPVGRPIPVHSRVGSSSSLVYFFFPVLNQDVCDKLGKCDNCSSSGGGSVVVVVAGSITIPDMAREIAVNTVWVF